MDKAHVEGESHMRLGVFHKYPPSLHGVCYPLPTDLPALCPSSP
jgi:hypothetical protein